MGKLIFLWAFFILAGQAWSADSDGIAATGIQGAVTYPTPNFTPPAASSSTSTATSSGTKPSIVVPTPDTIAPPSTGSGAGTTGIIAPPTTPPTSLGKYRNARQEVRIADMIHDRYKGSVVRVLAKDLAGNVLAKAMGVGVGRNAQFIAAPLSLVLGTSQQWADRIEVTHDSGNQYLAKVAFIDEEKNLVLLSPEASPAPIVFARTENERPHIDVFTISFETAPNGSLTSSVHRGRLAAVNTETGLLSISPNQGQVIDDKQAGTGLIDSEGNLIGMLLPGGRGVLSSTLQNVIAKASKAKPIEPSMIGVILGRGVLVDPKASGAYKTITEALEAIKKGEAPKADPSRYVPAKDKSVAPKGSDKIVVKVMPGTYREKKTIVLPSNISLSGSGPAQTTIVAPEASKPAILIQNASNVIVSGFRIVPAALQSMRAPALIISKSSNVVIQGNMLEAKGGVGAWANESLSVSFFGNTFARGTVRALSCDKSSLNMEANAFIGDWPMALALEKGCVAIVRRNLFFENKTAISATSNTGSVKLQFNTFVRAQTALRISGNSRPVTIQDSVFFECTNGIFAEGELAPKAIGRNAAWRTKFTANGKVLTGIDLVRSEPIFEGPESYDFRIQSGKGHTGSALLEPGRDLGAYQNSDLLGPYSEILAHSLGALTGKDDLATEWGILQ